MVTGCRYFMLPAIRLPEDTGRTLTKLLGGGPPQTVRA
jgi:hypothetical protein